MSLISTSHSPNHLHTKFSKSLDDCQLNKGGLLCDVFRNKQHIIKQTIKILPTATTTQASNIVTQLSYIITS